MLHGERGLGGVKKRGLNSAHGAVTRAMLPHIYLTAYIIVMPVPQIAVYYHRVLPFHVRNLADIILSILFNQSL